LDDCLHRDPHFHSLDLDLMDSPFVVTVLSRAALARMCDLSRR
jgi:hypothetical protein